ncbi:tetratricopeptide repeat protein [Puniceicoccus vermicola]|uniref:Tetratricopeptide repeat protein n=1 Tax=Puniceicoccus vermicola TaxID=388746 RepID=A0A7X1AXH0_9BACT|nr:tetratricopeptide repeat protein [Puniceicoccus vermicola]MBC2601838.1 tetratricopeptide repeat protein [Puniceicoccus vermicola]
MHKSLSGKFLATTLLTLWVACRQAWGIQLPPSDYEYSWLERQEINFENQQLTVELEPAVASEDWEKAEAILREAIENDPNNNALKGRLLTVLAEAGEYQEGLDLAYPLLEQNPRYTPLIIYIGNLENSLGNRETAAKAWTYVLALPNTPKDDRQYAAKSLYFDALATQNLEVALESSRIWAQLERSYASNLQYASALWKTGDRDESIEVLTRAVELAKPDERGQAEFYLAYTLLKLDRNAEAKKWFTKIATDSKVRDDRYRAALQLAYLNIAEGNMEAARQWLDSAAIDGEKDENWKKLYSQTLIQGGNPEATLAAVGNFFDSDQASFLTLLSFQFLRNGYEGLAYHYITMAADKSGLPENREADYWANRSYMAEKQDNFEDALDSINKALARDPSRVDWKIVRVRSLFMLGQSELALKEARILEQEVEKLPPSPENTRILNEAIDLAANSLLAEKKYRDVLKIADRFQDVYTGTGIYRTKALAQYYLEDYDDANDSFEEYFRLVPDPSPEALVEYGYLQEKRKEWDLATEAFTQAVQRNPYDLRSWETLTFVLVKAVENSEAVKTAKETIFLKSETLPSAEDKEQGDIEQSIINYKTLIADIERTWGFQAFANYNEFIPDGNDVFVTRDSALPAELGAQISYRPPVIGFRDYRTFDVFLRVIGQFDDNSIRPNEDTWQGGLGAEWKPFKTLNYVTSLEYLFKIGDQSRDGWLWRNRASYTYGDYPRESEIWWPTVALYGEAAWLFDREWQDQELSLYTEDRIGISWKLKNNISLTFPQVQGAARYLVDGYTDRSSYYYGGFGANLRYTQDQNDDQTNDWYVDFYLHYDWGRFLNADAQPTGDRFDGWAAGIRFYR